MSMSFLFGTQDRVVEPRKRRSQLDILSANDFESPPEPPPVPPIDPMGDFNEKMELIKEIRKESIEANAETETTGVTLFVGVKVRGMNNNNTFRIKTITEAEGGLDLEPEVGAIFKLRPVGVYLNESKIEATVWVGKLMQEEIHHSKRGTNGGFEEFDSQMKTQFTSVVQFN